MKNTREIIVERAIELFNEKGVEYGGMRELAALLSMRVSNITYYFATKDDLVNEITCRLIALNSSTLQDVDTSSLKNFLFMYQKLFRNQYAYRCLFISFVHLFTHHKQLAEQYKQNEKKRKQHIAAIYRTLVTNGYFKKDTDEETIKKLVAHLSLVARFWISEALISYSDRPVEKNITHYLTLVSDIFVPHVTAKGKKDIDAFLKEIA